MTTEPLEPSTISIPVPAPFQWLIHHAILLILVVGLGGGLFYFMENEIQKHDVNQEAKYNSLLTLQEQQTQTLQKQLAADEVNWTAVQKQISQENFALEQKILSQNQQTQKQVQNDSTLDSQQTAARISQQTAAKPGEVTAVNDNVILDLPISRVITSDLDLLAGTQDNLASTQAELKNEQTVNTNQQLQITQQTQIISGLQAQNADQQKACDARVGAVKAQSHKTEMKIAAVFTVVGIVAKRLLIGRW